eukprot:TRINITY_DN4127_c0_g1_i1.p1 TRINITY_DN4127_c0_g1~~TRINITY_DN4127_c0_g1_i1.p1  ORF type:complete len:395 (+),score=78.24 TRINITY_DN4127_c0_g1_i1:45-1187(+)
MKENERLQHKKYKKYESFYFDVDCWYEYLRDFTFASSFLPLSVEEVNAFVSYYHTRYNGRNLLSKRDAELILSLQNRIDKQIEENSWRESGVFIRLSSRSPKDGQPLEVSALLQALDEGLKTRHEGDPLKEANQKLETFFRVTMKLLRVTSGREALSLILSSERVFLDSILALDCQKLEGDVWRTQIVLRKWENRLREDFEFRGFVCNNQLTALSQYNHYCVFPHLLKWKSVIQEKINRKWAEVQELIPHPSYIIDFAILFDGSYTQEDIEKGEVKKEIKDEGIQVMIVELNPFATSTGASLFDWKRDWELLNGKQDFQFRLREELYENLPSCLNAFLSGFVEPLTQKSPETRNFDFWLNEVMLSSETKGDKDERGCLVG